MVIYKTTNLINGKYYIGKDSKNSKNYLGSGIAIKKAIKKYGKENFKKEIICECKNLVELNKKEKEIITSKIIEDPLSYNMILGGVGGSKKGKKNPNKGKSWEDILGNEISQKRKKEMKDKFSGENNPMYKKGFLIKGEKNGMMGRKSPNNGKSLSKETKNKISNKFKGKTWEELFGIENASERRINAKNRKRSYYIELVYLNGMILRFETVKQAIEILQLSSRKAYKNNYIQFKIRKIYGSI